LTDLLNHVALTQGKIPKSGLILDDFSYFLPETDLKQTKNKIRPSKKFTHKL